MVHVPNDQRQDAQYMYHRRFVVPRAKIRWLKHLHVIRYIMYRGHVTCDKVSISKPTYVGICACQLYPLTKYTCKLIRSIFDSTLNHCCVRIIFNRVLKNLKLTKLNRQLFIHTFLSIQIRCFTYCWLRHAIHSCNIREHCNYLNSQCLTNCLLQELLST